MMPRVCLIDDSQCIARFLCSFAGCRLGDHCMRKPFESSHRHWRSAGLPWTERQGKSGMVSLGGGKQALKSGRNTRSDETNGESALESDEQLRELEMVEDEDWGKKASPQASEVQEKVCHAVVPPPRILPTALVQHGISTPKFPTCRSDPQQRALFGQTHLFANKTRFGLSFNVKCSLTEMKCYVITQVNARNSGLTSLIVGRPTTTSGSHDRAILIV